MQNYRYNTSDTMRRGGYGCQTGCQTGCQAMSSVKPCVQQAQKNDCAKEDRIFGMPIAMAYVPWQKWCDLYDAEKGFAKGTIFQELDQPFKGKGGCCR